MDVDNLITTLYPVVKKYENAQAAFERLNNLETSKAKWQNNETKIKNLNDAKKILGKNNKELAGEVGELKDDITKLNNDRSSKEDDITKLNNDRSSKEDDITKLN
eukprot:731825_1